MKKSASTAVMNVLDMVTNTIGMKDCKNMSEDVMNVRGMGEIWMTNEEAIKIIEVAKAECEWNAPLDYQEAFALAIEALRNYPTSMSVTSDLISRQAAIDAMTNTLWHYPNELYRNLNEYEFAKGLAELGLKSVPSAQPESCDECKHLGKWENEVEYGYPSPCTHCKRRAMDHYER